MKLKCATCGHPCSKRRCTHCHSKKYGPNRKTEDEKIHEELTLE